MKKIFGSLFILLAFLGCKEKYISPVASPNLGYLVVEGTINSGTGITQIVLKRTVKLDNPIIVYEQGAIVTVDGQDNSKAFLTETSLGHYTAANLNLNNAKQYRLNIITKDGKVYQSDYTSSQKTPAIDSISWKQDASGIQLFVNSHDASGLNKYYQWDYTETWEYHSPNKQFFVYQHIAPPINKWGITYFDPILINFNAAIYSCWPTTNSTNIILGSSITLTDNKISLPLISIHTGYIKIGILYSIDTRQYGLSEAKYNYLQKMKKNTEGTGSVFDAQPSELVGNIHCTTNTSEPVVGYIDICNIQEIRTFIRNDQLPNWNFVSPCKPVELLNNIKAIDSAHGLLLPIDVARQSPFGGILSYYFDTPNCVDCTLTGSNIKPPFWP